MRRTIFSPVSGCRLTYRVYADTDIKVGVIRRTDDGLWIARTVPEDPETDADIKSGFGTQFQAAAWLIDTSGARSMMRRGGRPWHNRQRIAA